MVFSFVIKYLFKKKNLCYNENILTLISKPVIKNNLKIVNKFKTEYWK